MTGVTLPWVGEQVDLTDEVIGELLGKSAKTVGRARRDYYAAGMIEDLGCWKESVRVEGQGPGKVILMLVISRTVVQHGQFPQQWTETVHAHRRKRFLAAHL